MDIDRFIRSRPELLEVLVKAVGADLPPTARRPPKVFNSDLL